MDDTPEIQVIEVPGLATVTIDPFDDGNPQVEIVLDDIYSGDLNDLQQDNGLPPGVLFRGYHADAINSPELARFLEVLHHWDHDGDGAFDGDHVSDRIEAALWLQREPNSVFQRPNNGPLTDLLMRFMPPQPERHIVLGYGELKPRFKWWHYALGIPMIAGMIGLINLQFFVLPWTVFSVASGIGALLEHFGFIVLPVLYLAHRLLRRLVGDDGKTRSTHSRHTFGFFNRAAVYEEQAFREGAENWSWPQRAYACFAFGAIHLKNLIYPLATIVPLTLGGGIFMAEYLRVYKDTRFRRSAVLAASVVHRVYNRIALTAIVLSLLFLGTSIVINLLGLLALATFYVTDQAVDRVRFTKNERRQALESV